MRIEQDFQHFQRSHCTLALIIFKVSLSEIDTYRYDMKFQQAINWMKVKEWKWQSEIKIIVTYQFSV